MPKQNLQARYQERPSILREIRPLHRGLPVPLRAPALSRRVISLLGLWLYVPAVFFSPSLKPVQMSQQQVTEPHQSIGRTFMERRFKILFVVVLHVCDYMPPKVLNTTGPGAESEAEPDRKHRSQINGTQV